MTFQEFYSRTAEGEIFTRHTAPEKVRGVVVLVHGMGEHSGRYIDSVVPTLVSCNLAVVLYDHIGHGKSKGKRGHCSSYQGLLKILEITLTKAQNLYPDSPVFLYGHSMGGNVVLNYALRTRVTLAGIVAMSPFLRLAFDPPRWKVVLGRLMLNVAPSVTLPSGLDAAGISRNAAVVDAYRDDPLVHDRISPMFSLPVIEAGEWAIKNADQLMTDTLLAHGTADSIIDYQGTVAFHQNSAKADLRLFEAGYHELHHDVCSEELLGTIAAWLQERIV